MNFSSADIGIIVSMTLAVVAISFVFPALGLTGDEANDPPEFDISEDRFDFSSDFPDNPGTPTSGTADFDSTDVIGSENQIWFSGDTSGGVEFILIENASDDAGKIIVNNWDSGSVTSEYNQTFTSSGERFEMDDFGYRILFTVTEYTETDGEIETEVEYEIREQPSDEGWLDRIPVVGSIFGAGSAVASIIAWGISVIWWFFTSLWETVLNLLGMLFDVASFMIGITTWLSGTYLDVIAGASGFASVFVSIPGVILSLMIAKFVMVGIKLLPTT